MPGIHATLSASKAHQWMACPPSARLSQKLEERFGDSPTPYAAEGTQAHALAELKLRLENGELNKFNFGEQRKAIGDVPAEMDRATDRYVDIVLEKLYSARKSCPDAQLLIEQRLDFSPWVPHGFGTGDAVIISDTLLEVCDLKYGKGVPVSAVENPQARLYGLGALNEFGVLYGFTHVRDTIIQPRLDSVTEETLSREELLDWGESIVPVAEQAWRGEGEFKAGDHCKFCAARAICKARAIESMGVFVYGFDNPDVLPDSSIPEILRVADTAEAWLKDVRSYALSQALQGDTIPGYKLVRGRAPGRKWMKEDEVIDQAARAGYSEEQYLEPRKLMSVSNLEKSLGKTAFKALFGKYVTQGDGALTLVPESDKRPEYSSADAAFADLAESTDEN